MAVYTLVLSADRSSVPAGSWAGGSRGFAGGSIAAARLCKECTSRRLLKNITTHRLNYFHCRRIQRFCWRLHRAARLCKVKKEDVKSDDS